MTQHPDFDVLIVGAGTAGSAAAFHCARLGLTTLCIDQRPHQRTGAHWINGVPGWMFTEAGLVQPIGDELVGDREPFHLLAGNGPERIVIDDHDLLDVDMSLLVTRLRRLAVDEGAQFRTSVRVLGLTEDALLTNDGPIRARWYIDASGLAGARLLGQPAVAGADICSAAQEIRVVSNPRAARQWFASYDVAEGETLAFSGTAGGYSTVNARLAGDRVYLLTGSIPATGQPPGQQLLKSFVREQSWIGARISGGNRGVPVRRPHDRLANDRVALIGDAACQVFPAHGSGIGHGMVAARMLAEELAADGSPQTYAVRWMRRWGGLLAGADQFRRLSQTLDVPTLARLLSSGLINAKAAGRALDQLPIDLSVGSLRDATLGALRDPLLAARLSPVIGKSAALNVLYARYPKHSRALPAWSAAATAITGD